MQGRPFAIAGKLPQRIAAVLGISDRNLCLFSHSFGGGGSVSFLWCSFFLLFFFTICSNRLKARCMLNCLMSKLCDVDLPLGVGM